MNYTDSGNDQYTSTIEIGQLPFFTIVFRQTDLWCSQV